jgi:Ca2+-transporting ATPase
VVVATGSKTEIGEVAQLVKETKEEETPLQRKLSNFARIVGIVIIFITSVIFLEGIVTGNTFLEMFTVAVAVSIAAIPEGLPVAMTVILAIGMQNILKKRGLVRRLSSAETLGSCSVIATDKTGTLTQGKMQVADIIASSKEDRLLALRIAVLCNEAFVENPDDAMEKWIIRGRPTDKALLLAGIQAGINKKKIEAKIKKVEDIPFNSRDKFMVRVFSEGKSKFSYISGAPEKLLKMAGFCVKNGKKQKLTSKREEEIKLDIDSLSSQGLRVVGVGFKKLKGKDLVNNLVFSGLIAIKDPVRKDVKKAIKTVQEAGMRPIIVTGDYRLTAKAVAQEIGLVVGEENIMEGKDLDRLSDKEFGKVLKDIQIYARVEPSHKMRIVQAWQERGEVIAMTGDGINDAPALKKADIGVALGSGTEVAKEVSDLVLLSDNFSIIVAAVEEGRNIIDNIRKVITYLLSSSFTETIVIGASLLLGFPLPVTAAQILWVNLIEDGLPDIALAFEPKEKDIMRQKPKGHETPLLNQEMKVIIFIIGIITDIFLFLLFLAYIKFSDYPIEHIRTIIFAGLALDSLVYVFSCKSLRKNLWHINPFSNIFLVLAWLFGVTALAAGIYLPSLQNLLKTFPLIGVDWGIILSLSFLQLILIEITKYIFITRHKV